MDPRRPAGVRRHGGKILADQLVVHGADIVFSVPGESFLALLDGFYDSSIRLVTCRHEAGAANMAEMLLVPVPAVHEISTLGPRK